MIVGVEGRVTLILEYLAAPTLSVLRNVAFLMVMFRRWYSCYGLYISSAIHSGSSMTMCSFLLCIAQCILSLVSLFDVFLISMNV